MSDKDKKNTQKYLKELIEAINHDDAAFVVAFVLTRNAPTLTAIIQTEKFETLDIIDAVTAMSRAQIELLSPVSEYQEELSHAVN